MAEIAGKKVGSIGFGLMGFTWRQKTVSEEEAFDAMRTALSRGANFWNGGQLYGTEERNSLHLLHNYFVKYPEDAGKVCISIKGGVNHATHEFMGDKSRLTKHVEECVKVLKGTCKIDCFELARVDKKVEIEETVSTLNDLKTVGKIGGISLSEVSAETIRRAAKVAKIDAVEVEVSLYTTDIFENGVAKACAELDIPVVAYSPLGRGFLTGEIKTIDDVPDHIKHMPRFQPENFDNNLKLAQEVEAIAKKKGVKPAQIAISWVAAQSKRNGNPVIIPIPGGTTPQRVTENTEVVQLSDQELKDIDEVLAKCVVTGGRYPAAFAALEWG